jgi:hypothetical protein
MATTNVNVEPKGTIPLTGGAHGPFPCCISIQQSTLSPGVSNKSYKIVLGIIIIMLVSILFIDKQWRGEHLLTMIYIIYI